MLNLIIFLCFVQIQYADFDSNFYEEHPDIAALPRSQVDTLRNKLGIKVCKFACLFESVHLVQRRKGNVCKAISKQLSHSNRSVTEFVRKVTITVGWFHA